RPIDNAGRGKNQEFAGWDKSRMNFALEHQTSFLRIEVAGVKGALSDLVLISHRVKKVPPVRQEPGKTVRQFSGLFVKRRRRNSLAARRRYAIESACRRNREKNDASR